MLAGTGVRKTSFVVCGFSSIKIHYSINKINEVYVFSISDILLKKKKHIDSIHSILWNIVTVCFATIELVMYWYGFCGFSVT